MAWFKKTKKPIAAKAKEKASRVPEGLWVKCPDCAQAIYNKDLATNLNVCPKCDKPLPSDSPGGRCPECVLGLLDEATHLEARAAHGAGEVLPILDLEGGAGTPIAPLITAPCTVTR